MTTCPKCGRERAQDLDDAGAYYPDRCGAEVEGFSDGRCQEIAEAAARAVLEAMLRQRFDDPTIRVDSMRMTSPSVLHVKAHRSCPIALITLDLRINQEI